MNVAAPAHFPGPAFDRVDDVLSVPTPEKIEFQYELAGPVRRLGAWLIDLVVVQMGYFVAVILLVLGLGLFAGATGLAGAGGFMDLIGGMAAFAILVGALVVNWFYGAWAEARWNGRTLGKSWTGLRVLARDGGSINAGQAIIRNLVRYADLMPVVTPGLLFPSPEGEAWLPEIPTPTMMTGLVVMLILPGFRRLGDLVAGTMVVVENDQYWPELARFTDPRVSQLADLIPRWYVASPRMAAALAGYVDRRERIGAARTAEIASHIGAALLRHLDLPRDTNHDLLLCALYYRTFADRLAMGPTGRGGKP